jgi:hypothetical protein
LRAPAEQYAVSPDDFARFDWDQISMRTLAIYDLVIGQTAEQRLRASA